MTHARKRGLCWLIAALMTAAMMVFVLTCTDVLYATNDDAGILRAFMGYETGEPAHFHIFVHGLLAWPLCWVSRLFPGLPWFSYAQMALLALSVLVIAKSLMQSALKVRQPLWLGVLVAAVFVLTLCVKYVIRLTFTQTAALMGAAAVAQILCIEHDRGGWRVMAGMAGALALVCLSYALRQSALLPVLGFCGLSFVLALWEDYGLGRGAKRPLRPMAASLALVAAVLAVMLGLRQWELGNSQAQDYLRWQEANTEIMDYVGIHNVPQEAFELVGWDRTQQNMVQSWCFLDEDISTDDFVALTQYMHRNDERTLTGRLHQAWELFCQTAQHHPEDMACLGVALLAALMGLLGAAHRRSLRLCVSLLGALLLSAVMIAYLALAGRLPLRALLTAALPAAVMCYSLLPACLPAQRPQARAVCAVLLAAVGLWSAAGAISPLLIDEQRQSQEGSAMTDLEEYAQFDPEALYIYDSTLSSADMRVFPRYGEEMPNNISSWGGWCLRSPESVAQFARYGIDLNHLDPRALLRDDVYIVSGQIDPPPLVILDWLREKIGPQVDYQIYSEYGFVYIFHFDEYEPEEL